MDAATVLVNIIFSILTLIAAIQLTSKFPQTEGYLLVIGAITSTIAFASIFLFRFVNHLFDDPRTFFTIYGIVMIVGNVCFTIGFFMLVRKLVVTSAKDGNQN